MFSIYLDDKILYSTDLYDEYDTNLISPSCTVEIGRAGALSFTLPPSHYLYGEIKKLVSVVRAYYMRTEVFNGRVLQTSLDTERNKTVQCEGNLTYFLDSAFPPLEEKMTVKDFFLLCIATHNAQVEPAKQFTPGIINAKKINEEEVFSLTGFTDIKSVLDDSLINAYGGYLRTRALGDRTYIDYLKDYGKISNQVLEFGENILEYSQEEDANDIFTVLIPIGDIQQAGGQDSVQVKTITTIAPVNNGSTMIDLPIGQDKYGRIVKTETFSGISDPQELKNKALQYIEDNHTEPPLKISLRAIDLKVFNWSLDMFEVGVQYRVVSKPHNIDQILTCSKIDYKVGDLASTQLTLEVLKQQVGGNSFRPLKGESLSSAVGGSSGGRGGGSGGKAWKHIIEGDDWVQIAAKKIDIIAEDLDIQVKNLRIEAKDTKEGLETSISQTATEIRLEAKNTKEGLESSISQTATQIRLEVNDTKQGLQTSINQTATEIRLEATNTKLGLESSISQTAEQIRAEVRNTEENLETSISQTASEIRLEAKNTKEGLESSISQTATQIRTEVKNTKTGLETSINQTATQLRTEAANTKAGLESSITQTATQIRAEVKNTKEGLESSISQTATQIRAEITDTKNGLTSYINQTATNIRAEVKRTTDGLQSSLDLKAESATLSTVKGQLEGSIQTLAGEVALKASAADMNSKLNLKADSATLTTVKGQLEGSIQTLAGEVNLKASTASMNSALKLKADSATLETVKGNLQSSITTNANNINLKVSKNGVITSINVSSEGVKINAAKLNVSGIIEAGSITVKNDLDSVSARINNIISGNIQATLLSAVRLNAPTIDSSNITAKTSISAPIIAATSGLALEGSVMKRKTATVVTGASITFGKILIKSALTETQYYVVRDNLKLNVTTTKLTYAGQ